MMARNLLESAHLLATASRTLADRALAATVANEDTCRGYVEISPSMATALNPLIGYDKAAEIAKRSVKERRPVRELAAEMTSLSAHDIEQALDPMRQTRPGLDLGGGAGG
jgi:fumarate hydratase class II